MNNQSYNIIIKQLLEESLSYLKTETQDFVVLTEKAIGPCYNVMSKLRVSVQNDGFSTKEEGIYFFKYVKPKVDSKFIFYTEVFNIESHRPEGGKKIQLRYFQNEIQQICTYQKNNKELYQYYKRNKTDLDHIYFLRGNLDSRIHEDNISCHIDPNFCTGYDKTLAKIMANEQLKKYIGNEIRKLKGNAEFVSNLYWTNPNIDALEIVYSLFLAKATNNGKASLIEIARAFEKMFNLKFKNICGTFKEIQGRADQTSFLRHLIATSTLQKYLDELEE